MKRRVVLMTGLAVAVLWASGRAAQTGRPSGVIDAAALLHDAQVLAADDMQGRQVDTAGGAKARAYVIERFKASGVAPFGQTYEEPFTFTAGRGDAAAARH